ncbi:LANO_0G02784g1_1 [Lachancea nothofagi CBS 11611]|uniref:Large ribosomal subunit protein mL46 n=1 Tax=Lachancea nothofagi CBS 11611 TaxID=1266666 RepID=A0A1G4KFE7_9SACH|nr:LANO_0G02784g1_1 [Lachancea nothofagi CBS 11611]
MRFQLLASRGVASASKPAKIKAGLILSRIPIVTPDLTTLERQYYEYQSELERRLMWTFPQYFYFRKGTLAEKRFLAAQKGPVSKQPGVWFPKGVPDIKHNRERSLKQEVSLPQSSSSESNEGVSKKDDISRPVVPNSRLTHADESNDVQSLERKLSSTLYLLVKSGAGKWAFPSFPIATESAPKQPLHVTAELGLRVLGGPNINTWSVSSTPAGVLGDSQAAEFLIKSHIISGRFELQSKSQYDEFAWLTKNEIQQRVDNEYYQALSCLLADD